MSYDRALQFLSRLVNYEQKAPFAHDLTLVAMRTLLARLANPHERLAIVHVAGSKGKGSYAAMLERSLRCAGYRTGLYTSPHLTCLEERIRVNGVPISKPAMAEVLAKVEQAIASSEKHLEPSFFDVMTTAAFLCFERENVDVAVLEVGMGGRADSTNVCLPRVAAITSISFDHTKQLGNTLALIAAEKAGIVKPGCPTVSGVIAEEPRRVVEMACEKAGSPLIQLGADVSYRYFPGNVTQASNAPPRVEITTPGRTWPIIPLSLLGAHQAANAALAVATIEQLQRLGFRIGDEAVIEALSQTQWPARIEVMSREPLVILDCAHNTASAQALVDTLQTSFPDHVGTGKRIKAKRTLLFAASRDKDLVGIMAILAPHFDNIYLTQYTTSQRCAPVESALAALRKSHADVPCVLLPDPIRAWETVQHEAGKEDVICVTGSVFLAGELRAAMLQEPRAT